MSTPRHPVTGRFMAPGDEASDVDAAVAAAAARSHALEAQTFGFGSVIGEVLALPDVPTAHSKHAGGDDAGYPA